MENNVKRLYKEKIAFMLAGALVVVILILILFPTLNPQIDNLLVLTCIPFVIMLLWLIVFGYLTPVRISPSGIKYNRTNIGWNDVELVLYPARKRGTATPMYYVIWGNHDMNYRELRCKILKGQFLYLSSETIGSLLQYYDKPIKVLNYDGRKNCEEGNIISSKRLNSIVNDHNAKYTQD